MTTLLELAERCEREEPSRALARFADRFWSFVEKGAPDECWPWSGTRSSVGPGRLPYGRFYLTKKKTVRAHRFAWMLHNQMPVPEGLVVAHSCDNPPCCNPRHLWIGTVADNNADREAKGRSARTKVGAEHRWKIAGHLHGRAKLTPAQVVEIRGWGGPSRVLADRFGLSRSQICRIRRGDNWGANADTAALRALAARDGA
jgi:hypothetical protein